MLDAVDKLSKLLSAKQKRQALGVFGLMLLAAVFEFVSVTLFLPFVSILTQPSIVLSNRYLSALKDALGLATATEFAVLLGLTTVLVIWVSMLVRACNVYFISRFGFSVMHALSLDMMRLNLSRDYLFYLKQNTADLTRRSCSAPRRSSEACCCRSCGPCSTPSSPSSSWRCWC